MAKNFPDFMKGVNQQIQQAEKTSNRINPKKSTEHSPSHL
jgi:hypothetical protein